MARGPHALAPEQQVRLNIAAGSLVLVFVAEEHLVSAEHLQGVQGNALAVGAKRNQLSDADVAVEDFLPHLNEQFLTFYDVVGSFVENRLRHLVLGKELLDLFG